MGSPWPAPESGARVGRRAPNYALRRAVVGVVVVSVIAVAAAWWIGRGGEDDGNGTGASAEWETVVLQDPDSGRLTLFDTDGEEVEAFSSDLIGMLDVGLDGRLVVGTESQPSVQALGVVDLGSGDVTTIEVAGDTISRLDTSQYLLAAGDQGAFLGLVDVGASEAIDLLAFADNDDPIVKPSMVRIDESHQHVAFTELGELETVLVDIEARTSVSLAGSLVDLTNDAVLTTTNRGRTTLVDLYGLDGERVGTVETDAAAGALLLDGRSALIVTRGGQLVRIDFDDESVTEVASVTDLLTPDGEDTSASAPQSGNDQTELVNAVVPLLDRTRLVVRGSGGVVVVDVDGTVIASDRVTAATLAHGITSADRCVLVGSADGEQTLWDTSDGQRIETFDAGTMLGRSADACTITYQERSTPARSKSEVATVPSDTGASATTGTEPASSGDTLETRFVGPDLDRSVTGVLGAVAPDGSAAIGQDNEGAFVLRASGDRIELRVDTLLAVFTNR